MREGRNLLRPTARRAAVGEWWSRSSAERHVQYPCSWDCANQAGKILRRRAESFCYNKSYTAIVAATRGCRYKKQGVKMGTFEVKKSGDGLMFNLKA